ncbi:MAG: hypothetical protein WC437_05075 [Patescibacteria group bacterium]|jgi:amino acid transporter|nr:hypothetical protein [Patescibacteria group bacterium]
MSDLKNKVMESIKKDEVKMHSKNFFRFTKALIEIVIVGIALLVIFLINLSFYLPRKGLGLCNNRWDRIIGVIPWWIVILGIGGIAILIWIIYRYTGAYKKRLIIVIGTVSVAIVISGFLLSVSNFNETVGKGFGRFHNNQQNMNTNNGYGNGNRGDKCNKF